MKNKQSIRFTIFFSLIFILLISLIFIFSDNFGINPDKANELPDNYVINVIDGDTFQTASGDTIRLLCVNTPEENQEGYQEAKEFLEELILGNQVTLEKDISETDKYGRLLRYVYLNLSDGEVFVNKEIVKNGYGEIMNIEPDVKKCGEMN